MGRTIDIRLLGAFTVRVADAPAVDERAFGRSRPMQLVQMLALADNHRLVRDQVIDALWPDLDPDAGAANLRKAAHHARRVLGDPDAVVLRGGIVTLFPDDDVRTDVSAFLRDARSALDGGDPRRCSAVADSAPGDLLPGSPYDEWTLEPRRAAAAIRLELLRGAGRWADAIAAEPTDEESYRGAMREALADGRRAEAIRWYGVARDALARDLGVAPGPAIEALRQEALEGLGTAPTHIVGRELEIARATVALEGPSSRVRAVAVRGPAGIGKSALVRAVLDAVDRDTVVVHEVAASDPHRPYGPIADLLDGLTRSHPHAPDQLAPHERAVLAAVTDVGGADLTLPLSRHQVIGAVTDLLHAVAGDRPTLLVVDDLHDADDATVGLVAHLASSVDRVRLLVGYRPAASRRQLTADFDRLDRAGTLLTLDLPGLTTTQADALVRSSTDAPLGNETVDRIIDLGDGNPFALIELARAAGGADTLPRTAAEAITNRLVGLGSATMAMLERVALAESDLDTATVAALADADAEQTSALLDEALEAGVLDVIEDRYRFRHDLVREALAALVPPHRRVQVHGEAARRLVATRAPAAAIARHWLLADRPDEAGPWCLRAGQEAASVGAFVDARRHLAPLLAEEPRHPAALRLEAECLDMLGDPTALTAYDAAIDVAGEDEADDLVVARALAQIKQGDPAGGLQAVQGAHPRSLMGRINEALTYAGAAALGATDPTIGTAKATECRRLALEGGDRGGIVIAAWAHAAAAHARGDLHDSVVTDLRETAALPDLAVRVFDGHLCMTQRFLYGSRPYAEVIAFADELTAEAERLDAARGRAFGVTLRGEAHLLSGDLDAADDDLRAALELHRETGGTTGEAHAVQRLAEAAQRRGNPTEARALVDEALALARASDIGFHLFDRIYGSRISTAATPDEGLTLVEEAEEAVRGPLETCPGCRVHLAVPAAIASARAGDVVRAERYGHDVDYLADVVMRLPAWYAARSEVQANLALLAGDPARARNEFCAAAEAFAAAGQPADADRCRTLAGTVDRG